MLFAAAKAASRSAVASCHHPKDPSPAWVVVHHLAEEDALLPGAARGRKSSHETAVAKSAEGTNKGQVRDSSNVPPVEGES